LSHDEWFRKSTWTQEDQDDFFKHLEESGSDFHKAQYVRIQALHLQDAGTPRMFYAAIKLLELMIEKWPEPSQLPMAYLQKAECLDALGLVEEAIQAYRDSLDAKRSFPKAQTEASISFGMFAVDHELTSLYDEVDDALDEFRSLAGSPAREYHYFAVKAIIAKYRGDIDKACDYAKKAIDAAQKTYSGTHYDRSTHELRDKPYSGLHEKICELAGLK